MSNPLITIAIPTWNRATILDKALNALLPQIENNKDKIEIVISDNGSDDNTSEIIEKHISLHNTLNIVHFTQRKNTGYYGNFKKCRELSNGDYFWLLSDNDYVANGLINYLLDILINNQPSFVFLRDWKHDAKVGAYSSFKSSVYTVKEGIEKFNYKTTLISAVVFNNDKSNDTVLFEKFNENTFLGFAYFLQSLKNKDKAFEIIGTSLFINDAKVSFNAFKSFGVDLMACFKFAIEENILSKETVAVFINKVISGLTVKHYILYRITGSLHGKKHKKEDVDKLITEGFSDYKAYHEELKPLQESSGLKFYILVFKKHLFKIIKEQLLKK